jgi:hypothetical protein
MASSGASRLGIVGAAAPVSFGDAAVKMMVASNQYYKAELESGVGRIPGAIGDRSPTAPIAREPRRLSDVVNVAQAPSPAAVATKTSGVGMGVTALLALAAFGFLRVLGWWSPDSRGVRLAARTTCPRAAPC